MNNLGWIHIFTVTDTQKHKGGYTIYKITSVVFPRALPEALTCLTVWKRFHDVKRLYRGLSRRHKSLHLNGGSIPEPTDASYFKRFDTEVIQRRKAYILELLDFAAKHSALYKCHIFTNFFSGAEQTGGLSPSVDSSPLHRLHLKGDAVINTGSGLLVEINKSIHSSKNNEPNTDKANNLAAAKKHDAAGEKQRLAEHSEEQEPCKDFTRFLTPMASIEEKDSDYIYEAALDFSRAVQSEVNLEYPAAHASYKRGVELLLNGSKDDCNDERKFIAKAKISKYLARADDIYDQFLRHSQGVHATANNFQLSIDVSDGAATTALYLERPWNNLAKYKVLRVLGERVMQVECITEPTQRRSTYVMKGIEKPSSNSPTQTVFLPQHVPYMVELLAFFQSDQKIFLLLKQAEGGRLDDYIQTYSPNKSGVHRPRNFATLFRETAAASECLEVECTTEVDSTASNFDELVRCSQQLTVTNTLKQVGETPAATIKPDRNATSATDAKGQQLPATRIPEASLKHWARELAVTVHSLHGKGVILGDLNMDNLLLGAKGQLLLTYFYQNEGAESAAQESTDDAATCMHKRFSVNAIAGHYLAPERPLTRKSDWWSYGVILYQLLVGLPFKTTHPGRIDLYGSVQYPENFEISAQAQDLLDHLLLQTPTERYGYEQLQQHDFFRGTNWSEVQCNGYNQV